MAREFVKWALHQMIKASPLSSFVVIKIDWNEKKQKSEVDWISNTTEADAKLMCETVAKMVNVKEN